MTAGGPPGAPVRRDRRALSNVGGAVDVAGDHALSTVLANALAVPQDPDASREHVHGFHSYPARLHPHTARVAVRGLCSHGAVLDPFCGSGTVLVEARLAGKHAWGIDANPLAVRLSELKSSGRPESYLRELCEGARSVAAVADERRKGRWGASQRYPDVDRDAFDPHVLLELDGLRVGLRSLASRDIRGDLELVLSAILTKVSRRAGDSAEGELPKRIAAGYPAKIFVRKADELVERLNVYQAGLPPRAPRPAVTEGDARDLDGLKLPPVGLVLTSPPYPGNYDYLHHHEMRLRWLGLSATAFDKRELGARRHLSVMPFHDAVARWQADVRAFLAQMARLLARDGKALFIIADSVIGDRAVDNERLVAKAASEVGLSLVARASQPRPHFHGPSRNAFREFPRREHALLLAHAAAAPKAPRRIVAPSRS